MTLSNNELEDWQKMGISMLIGLLTDGHTEIYPGGERCSFKADLKGTKWDKLTHKQAEEIAYDIVVGAMMDRAEQVKNAKQRWLNKRLGFEKCIHLSFNLPNDWKDDKIKDFIYRFHHTTWACLSRALFIVEFFGKAGNYNPHIHVWMPYIAPGKIKQLATRKFGKECNVWVGNGHKNLLPYIKGIKRESKEVAVEADKLYRAENGYEDYYEFS